MAERVVSWENIFQLLSTLVGNIHLSYMGVLQVAAVSPEARTVCGKRAWEHLGRKVKPDAVPIEIYFPMLEGKQRFQMVKVYDVESTEGAPLHGSSPRRNFADRITQITGAVWELAEKLGSCSRECLGRLCRMKWERRLFSWPGVEVEN